MGESSKRIGDYILGETLGAGGMGTVFRAQHMETGARVAFKMLHPLANPNTGEIRRFDLRTGARLGEPLPAVGAKIVLSMAYSADARTLATLVGAQERNVTWLGNLVVLHDVEGGRPPQELSFSAPGRCVTLSPDSAQLFVGTTIGQVLRFSTDDATFLGDYADPSAQGGLVAAVAHPRASMRGLLFGAKGRRCYSVARGDSGAESSLALWVDGALKCRRPRPYYLRGIKLSPNKRLLALTTRAGVVEVWRVR